MRVLIIEKSAPIAAVMRKSLEDAGKEVEVVAEPPPAECREEYDAIVQWRIFLPSDNRIAP